MTMQPSDRVEAVPPSGIRKFFEIAEERDDVISLGVGEPDFSTPWAARDAAIDSLRRGRTSYTANRGCDHSGRRLPRMSKDDSIFPTIRTAKSSSPREQAKPSTWPSGAYRSR
ncbi:MAG: hypothetical protein U5K37_05680 [Natrialbaceae archaeon]|nr:hypothetical protein [Natrialbaceae archaeon]